MHCQIPLFRIVLYRCSVVGTCARISYASSGDVNWSSEYLSTLNRYNKWRYQTRNISVGNVVILKEDSVIPTKWPLAKVVQIHPGRDNIVRIATIRTSKGTYHRPIAKLAMLISHPGTETEL